MARCTSSTHGAPGKAESPVAEHRRPGRAPYFDASYAGAAILQIGAVAQQLPWVALLKGEVEPVMLLLIERRVKSDVVISCDHNLPGVWERRQKVVELLHLSKRAYRREVSRVYQHVTVRNRELAAPGAHGAVGVRDAHEAQVVRRFRGAAMPRVVQPYSCDTRHDSRTAG
eukprot:scaffold2364_cov426-Prasinococcus_capsulatus_cf.AAC.8